MYLQKAHTFDSREVLHSSSNLSYKQSSSVGLEEDWEKKKRAIEYIKSLYTSADQYMVDLLCVSEIFVLEYKFLHKSLPDL